MKKYVIMHVDGQVMTDNNTAEIVEIYAVLYDENLHKKQELWYIPESQEKYRQLQTYVHEKIPCIADMDKFWSELLQIAKEDVVFLVWGQTEKNIITRVNRAMKKNRFYRPIASLKDIYRMAVHVPDDMEVRIKDCMEEMELTFYNQRILDPFYKVNCLFRIFQKMCRHCLKQNIEQFTGSLRNKPQYAASKLDLTFAIENRWKKHIREIFHYTYREGYNFRLEGSYITVETNGLHGKVQISENELIFHYYTNCFYRGLRKKRLKFDKGCTAEKIAKRIIESVVEIETNLAFGVGNDTITKLLERITE